MKPLILASTSFRRQELLGWLGMPFTVIAPDFDEHAVPREKFPSIEEYLKYIATGKALSVAAQFSESVILSGDTMVEFQGELFGKPRDIDHAREMLNMLSGKTHRVYSAVCLVNDGQVHCEIVISQVLFKRIAPQQLENYLTTGESLGKAGSYAIQGGAKKFLEKIEGSATNVLGLPLVLTQKMLEEAGYKSSVNVEEMVRKNLSGLNES